MANTNDPGNKSGSQTNSNIGQNMNRGQGFDQDINSRKQERMGGTPNTTGAGETSRGLAPDDLPNASDDVNSPGNVNSRGANQSKSNVNDVNDRGGSRSQSSDIERDVNT